MKEKDVYLVEYLDFINCGNPHEIFKPNIHLGMYTKQYPDENQKCLFINKCYEVFEKLNLFNQSYRPMVVELENNDGYVLSYLFYSNLPIVELAEKFGDNFYYMGRVPNRMWVF